MYRILPIFVIFLLLTSTVVSPTYAAIVSVSNEGEMTMNVLPAQDDAALTPKPDYLKVTNVANTNTSEQSEIEVKNESGKVELVVNDGKEVHLADVTGYSDEIIEIEQRREPDRITISVSGDGFLLKEKNTKAYTSFPIKVDPEQRRISVETTSGEQYIAVLPSEALSQLVQGNVLNVIDGDYLIISEGEMGEVQYTIHGKRTLDILNIFQYEVPITAHISASSGEVLTVEQPVWLPIASFLFA